MNTSKLCLRFLSMVAIVLVAALSASAQYRAGIQGTILDPQGAVVEGAKVTVTANDTGLSQEATSDASGVYNIFRLAPGLYTVVVEKTGFKKKLLDNIEIIPEQVNALNISLEIGQLTESITVNGTDIPAIDTESGAISGTITSQQIQSLP